MNPIKTTRHILAAISLGLTGVIPATATAASGNWTGNLSATWQLNGNWSGASFPSGSDSATFNGAGSGNTTITLGGTSLSLGTFGSTSIIFDTPGLPAYSIANGTFNAFQGGTFVQVNAAVMSDQSIAAGISTDSQALLNTSESIRNLSPDSTLTLGNLTTTAGVGAGTVAYRFQGLGNVVVAGSITDNVSGGGQRLVAIANARHGTLTLSGTNNFTGLVNTGSGYDQNVGVSLGGTVIFDYSAGNAVVPTGMSLTTGYNTGGNVAFRGNATGTTSITLNATQRLANTYSTITVDSNGGDGTTLNLGQTWLGYNTSGSGGLTHFDLSSGGRARVAGGFSGGSYEVANGIIRQIAFPQSSRVTVKGTDGKTYFATLDADGYIVAQTNLTAMPTSGGDSSTQYRLGSSLTRTANFQGGTLRIEAASAGQSLNMGGFTFNTSGQILMDGSTDFTISNYSNITSSATGGIGIIVMGNGKLTLNGTKTSGDLTKFGPGLLEIIGNHSGATTASTRIFGGTLRAASANALTGGVLSMENGVLELGYDFARALGTGTGQVRALDNEFGTSRGASMGFSAYGANRTVNLGGAGAAVTFGSGGFVASRDAKFLLSSTTADARVDFQNPLNLNNDVQTIEVRNGSAAVDARLSGAITNGSFNKTGTGTLELAATNTYAGTTVVAEGTLLVNGSNNGGGLTSVNSGGTLGGVGSTAGSVTVAGTLSPGNSIGRFTSGNLSFISGSTFRFELDSSAPLSTGADLQSVNGGLNLSGTVALSVSDIALSPTAFSLGTVFSLVNYTGAWNGGLFSVGGVTIANGATVMLGANHWQFNYDATTGGSNFSGDYLAGNFVNITVVPEPNVATFLVAALVSLLVWRRFRKVRA